MSVLFEILEVRT